MKNYTIVSLKKVFTNIFILIILFSFVNIRSTFASYHNLATVTTLAGAVGIGGVVDGTGTDAHFYSPKGMSVDSTGNIYTVDAFCGTVRKITPTGVVAILAGSNTPCAFGSVNGTGPDAQFFSPSGTAVDSSGNVYVADSGNCTLRKVTPGGVVTTLAGLAGSCTDVDGTGSGAHFVNLAGVAVDTAGNVYTTSYSGCTIRKVTPVGVVTTIAGVSQSCAETDGTGTDARFNNPSGITIDIAGNFFIADETGCTIRKMTPLGVVTTLAGSPNNCGSADGTGNTSQFNVPSWTGVDSADNVYVTDYLNYTIRKVTQAGVVTTLAGLSGVSGSTDGSGTDARINHPDGIAVDRINNIIYVADRNNYTVRKIIDNSYFSADGNGPLVSYVPPPVAPIANPPSSSVILPPPTLVSIPNNSTITVPPPTATITASLNNNLYNFGTNAMGLGSISDSVKELQRFFNDTLQTNLKKDGILGPKTLLILKKWQSDHGLVPDGIVGPKTRGRMEGI
jgi:hypothetical protein